MTPKPDDAKPDPLEELKRRHSELDRLMDDAYLPGVNQAMEDAIERRALRRSEAHTPRDEGGHQVTPELRPFAR